MRTRRLLAAAACIITVAALSVTTLPASAAPTAGPATAVAGPAKALAAPANVVIDPNKRMPSDVPSKKTPWVTDGEVTKIVQVGNTMIAGGLFTTVSDPMNGTQYSRQNLFAFDKTTGLVSQTFNPTVDGQVQQLMPGPLPNTVYVAGDFTKINGKGPNHLQVLDITTGQAVTSFKAPSTNGGIETMELLPNNRLFIGGFFTKIGGVAHGQLGTLNATTGALDPYMDFTVAGHHNNSGSGAQAPIGPRESDVTPAGDRLIVVGNFRTVGGLDRDQIVMIKLDPGAPSVATDWYTTGYTPICSPRAFDSYMRDVDFSPDGSYFVIAVTGGPHTGTLCDTATRWETYATGTNLSPTWTQNTGGDTLWGVGITDNAIYVGGHPRWINNPNGSDRAAQGAVPRPGIFALDPTSGIPLKWNPGRNPRGEAAYDIYPVSDGIYIVSDTDWIGDRRYQRPRIAFFPYDTGYNIASTAAGSLPGNVYIASPVTNTNVLYRVNAGGSALAAVDSGPDWAADTSAAPSTYHNTGSSTATQSSISTANLVNVPASTPTGVWTSERNDPTGGNEMQWSFPVATGTQTEVRLYIASRSSSTRRFNVLIDGVQKLGPNYDPNVDPGVNKGTMKTFTVTSDGTVNIDFTHGNAGNPLINAIEIINADAVVPPNATATKIVNYDGANITGQSLAQSANFDWTNVRGAVMVGRQLFYGKTDGMMYKRSFDGVNFGDETLVDPYRDPLWANVPTGSGPTSPVQTYLGMLPSWYSTSTTTGIAATTGMFYWNGRIYYTKSGSNSLFWRYFHPDAGIVGALEFTASGGNISWSTAKGMFVDGNTLYVVNGSNGQLLKIGFQNGAPTGTSSVADTSMDWRGRALFLASVLPNVAPSAAFTPNCTGVDCTFDSSLSGDPDGTIASYDWDFGDGEGSGEESPQHTYLASGTYTVTLTVTDDQDATATISHDVTVEKPNEAPTADFTRDCTYLDCAFTDASTDADGTITGHEWDFGDGETSTEASPAHTFDQPGSYDVTLTVTDDDNATGSVTKTFTVTGAPAASTVSFVGIAVNQGNVATPNVTSPAAVQAGDRLVLALSLNANNRVLQAPTGITGWTVLDTTTTSGMMTRLYTKAATAADANKKVTVTIDTASKYTMTIAAYRGVRDGSQVLVSAAETESRTAHTTPGVQAPEGSWVVSYWADKSSATTGFALPGDVTSRSALCGANAGRICSVLGDSAGPVATGAFAGRTATADSASANATMSTFVLRTQAANIPPQAAFSQSCDSLGCDFNGGGSSDSDGQVVSYSWDFGDGDTATGPTPTHTFPATGTYDVSLTVTDNENGQNTLTKQVSVVRTNAAPTAAFGQSCSFLDCVFTDGSSDTDGSVVAWAWDFGDGGNSTAASPQHTFASTGPYSVTLTVTDNDGAQTSVTKTVNVVARVPIAFVAANQNTGNVASPNAVVPAGAAAGDRLVMVLNVNAGNRVLSDPTGVTGWNLLDTTVSGGMATAVYTKVAAANDGGRTVRVPMDAAAKYTMSVAVYRGDMLVPTFADTAETVNRPGHTTPTATAPDGAWVVSAWADKSSATTGFTLPDGTTSRSALCAATTGRVCSVLADSNGPVAAGQVGGLTAVADSSQASATMWTIVLRPM